MPDIPLHSALAGGATSIPYSDALDVKVESGEPVQVSKLKMKFQDDSKQQCDRLGQTLETRYKLANSERVQLW